MAALASLEKQCESTFTIVPLFDHTKGAFPIDHIAGACAITCKQVARLLPYHKKHKQHPGTCRARARHITVAANQVSEQYPPSLLWHPIKG